MSEKTKEEIKDIVDEIFDGIKARNSIEDIEYVENLRKEYPILDSYISILESEIKEMLR